MGSEEEQREVLAKFGCNATQRESVLPYTLSPLQTEFITDFTSIVDSGIVSITVCVSFVCIKILYQFP